MSGAIYDPSSIDIVDTSFLVGPLTGSVFEVTGAVIVSNFPSVQTITGNITTTTIQQTSSVTANYKITASSYTVTALSSNSNRKGASFYKEGAGNAFLLLGTGSASSTNFTAKLNADTLYETPYNYTGPAQIIFSTTPASSFVTVTEFV